MYYCASIGVGKTSLVNLIVKGTIMKHPSQTIGCTVDVKVCHKSFFFFIDSFHDIKKMVFMTLSLVLVQHFTYGSPGSSSDSAKGDKDREFFIELWDVSGHDRYADCRSIFYSQINGMH